MTTLLLLLLFAAVGLFMTWMQISGRGFALDKPATTSETARSRRRRRAYAKKKAVGLQRKVSKKYQAVTIATGLTACEAAEALQDQRFLASEAPQLPLAECDASSCKCKYRKYRDRRNADERRFSFGAFGDIKAGHKGDRRAARGRRSADS